MDDDETWLITSVVSDEDGSMSFSTPYSYRLNKIALRCVHATRHKWIAPWLTPARESGTWFTYPGGMEGWVELGGWLHTEMVYPPTDGHPSKY